MCGRFTLRHTKEQVEAHFHLKIMKEIQAEYNIAPTRDLFILTKNREPHAAKWGFVSRQAKDEKFAPINAKSETVATTFPFKFAFKEKQTCLVPASAFYEWQKLDEKTKQPWAIGVKGDREPHGLLAFAGLWETHEGSNQLTCTILTTSPNDLVKPIHTRMPVIVPPEDYDRWLNDADPELLKPYPAKEMWTYKVSKVVNNPRNNSPVCLEPLKA
jgi:putative SOS response-associated peptidase YedK